MSYISPAASESSIPSCSTTSEDVDEETRKLFKNIKIMSKDELTNSTEKCKEMISDAVEMSSQRKWLIRKLIEMRLRLANLNALRDFVREDDVSIEGHHFKLLKTKPSKRIFCDCCNNIIWIFQQCYSCVECFYNVHGKCLKFIVRICAHIVASEKGVPEYRICPEIGLSLQTYRCAECKIQMMNKNCYFEPRKCHYSGLFFCKSCHWNDYSIIPSNIIHNWDFQQMPVSRMSLQEINLFYERPVIRLEEINSKLFIFVQKLGNIRQKRLNLMEMKRYLDVCKFALSRKLIDNVVGTRRYLIQSTEFFSIYDLVCAENSSLTDFLDNIHLSFKTHIMKCEVKLYFHFKACLELKFSS
jgi:hypothetical protein